jgi:hypothetical protein
LRFSVRLKKRTKVQALVNGTNLGLNSPKLRIEKRRSSVLPVVLEAKSLGDEGVVACVGWNRVHLLVFD